jgi:hypothetical protein
MRLGWSGMTLAIDGRADVPLRHLSQPGMVVGMISE